MKNLISVFFSVLILLFVLFTQSVFAIEGACSDHGGVNCSIGADWDDSVICNDGWKDSEVLYTGSEECLDKEIIRWNYCSMLPSDRNKIYSTRLTDIWLNDENTINQKKYWDLWMYSFELSNEYLLKAKNASFSDQSYYLKLVQVEQKTSEIYEKQYDYYKLASDNVLFLNSVILNNECKTELDLYIDANKSPFIDVNSSHSNFSAIKYLKENKIISGYADGSFKPSNYINRAELLKIIVGGALGVVPSVDNYNSCFIDVKSEWFAPYVCYAKAQGWVGGYSDGSFRPVNNVTKAESIKMLLEAFKMPTEEVVTLKPFDDVDVNQWFSKYIYKAVKLGLLTESNVYRPNDEIMRGAFAENIYRLMKGVSI